MQEIVKSASQDGHHQTEKVSQPQSSLSKAPQVTSPDKKIKQVIGNQVRDLRMRKQMTAKELAHRAGISVPFLSRLEHGTVAPSLQTVAQLADGLGVPFTMLFHGIDSKSGASFVKAGNGLKVVRAGSRTGQHYELLGAPMDGSVQVEPYLITIDVQTKPFTSFQHEGIELIYVIEGGVIYRHGSASYEIKAGDSLFFDARQPHGPEEFLQIPTRFLSFIAYRHH